MNGYGHFLCHSILQVALVVALYADNGELIGSGGRIGDVVIAHGGMILVHPSGHHLHEAVGGVAIVAHLIEGAHGILASLHVGGNREAALHLALSVSDGVTHCLVDKLPISYLTLSVNQGKTKIGRIRIGGIVPYLIGLKLCGLIAANGVVELFHAIAGEIEHGLRTLNRFLQSGHSALGIAEGAAIGRAANALRTGLQEREHVIAVLCAAPAPVDMVEAFVVDAVDHEEVTLALARHAAIGNRARRDKLVLQHGIPVGCGEVVAHVVADALVVAEVFHHGRGNFEIISTRAVAIDRLHGGADVIHKGRHGIDGVAGRFASELGKHGIPVVVIAVEDYVDINLIVLAFRSV